MDLPIEQLGTDFVTVEYRYIAVQYNMISASKTAATEREHKSVNKVVTTKDTSYPTHTDELCGFCCEDLWENDRFIKASHMIRITIVINRCKIWNDV